MIIVGLFGGLGNQMFQYAAGQAAAARLATELKLDLSYFSDQPAGNTPRKYELNCFNLPQDFATKNDLQQIHGKPLFGYLFKKIKQKFKPYYEKAYFLEQAFTYDPHILDISGDTYLEGYWQSEKYFLDQAELIRNNLTFSSPPQTENASLLKKICSCNSIGIHIRRSDYLTNPNAHKTHSTCPAEYYTQALALLLTKVENPQIFVFSDDPSWAKKNILINAPVTFITHNDPEKGFEDLRLLSNCQHFIIANSSFSWWGAWLSKNKNKQVIAPKQWFKREKLNTKDLLPENWLKI